MSTRAEASVEDLRRVPENGKAELVDGKVVRMSPAGGYHGRASYRIVRSLEEHEVRTRVGHALPDNVGFLVDLPRRRSFSPDAAYYLGPLTADFLEGAPVFAVEIRSRKDYGPAAERRMATKRADYFAAGTLVVWDVDILGDGFIHAYRSDAPDRPSVFRRGDLADAEPAVPGWSMPVDSLWG